jgi:hypothetical protein
MGKAMHCLMGNRRGMDLLLSYCSQTLSCDDAPPVQRHVRVCAACGRFVAEQERIWAALDTWEDVPVSPDFNRKLYARIEAEEQRRGALARWRDCLLARYGPFSWRAPAALVAASAVLVLTLIAVVPDNGRQPQPPERSKIESIDFEQVERALDDMSMLKQLGPVLKDAAHHSNTI